MRSHEKELACRKLCFIKYSENNLSARASCLVNCSRMDPLRPLDYALTGDLSPAMYGLSGVVCGKIREIRLKWIVGRQRSNLYIFELEALWKPSATVTVKAVYSTNGWLISFLSRQIASWKTPEGKQVERTIVYSVKLIDTNDEKVKEAKERLETPFPILPIQPEILAIIVGVTAVVLIIIVIKKFYRRTHHRQ